MILSMSSSRAVSIRIGTSELLRIRRQSSTPSPSGSIEVEDDERRAGRRSPSRSRRRRSRAIAHGVARALQVHRDERRDARLVLDDEDRLLRLGHGSYGGTRPGCVAAVTRSLLVQLEGPRRDRGHVLPLAAGDPVLADGPCVGAVRVSDRPDDPARLMRRPRMIACQGPPSSPDQMRHRMFRPVTSTVVALIRRARCRHGSLMLGVPAPEGRRCGAAPSPIAQDRASPRSCDHRRGRCPPTSRSPRHQACAGHRHRAERGLGGADREARDHDQDQDSPHR